MLFKLVWYKFCPIYKSDKSCIIIYRQYVSKIAIWKNTDQHVTCAFASHNALGQKCSLLE